MLSPLLPDESERLAALHRYDILDTAPEEAFDDLTRLVSQICDTPVALVSLIDEDRQWFKSHQGLEVCQTARDVSFCAHAIAQQDLFIVPDAAADPRFSDSPLITGEPHVRFYAGMPLVTPDGYNLGTLCIIDYVPRELTAHQQETLRSLARLVMVHLESRLGARHRRQAEQALRESEESHRLLFEAHPHALCVHDPKTGAFLTVNEAATACYGYSRAEFLEMTLFDLCPAEDHPHLSRLLIDTPDDAFSVGEARHLRKDGSEVWVEVRVRAIEFAGRRARLMSAVDISERREADLVLQRMFSQSEHLLAALPSVLIAVDGGGIVTAWNAAAERVFGVARAETIGRVFEQCPLAWDWEPITSVLEECRATGKATRLENMAYRVAGGEIRLLGLNFSPLPRIQEQDQGFLLMAADITDRRHNEEKLIQSTLRIAAQAVEREQLSRQIERLSLISNKTSNAIIITDAAGRVEWVNESFIRITGYTLEEIVGRKPGHLLQGPGTDVAVAQALREAIQAGKPFDGEIYNYRKDGQGYWQTLSVNPILNAADQSLQGFIAIQTDIWTDRKRTEQDTARLAAIVDSSRDAIISENLDGTITSWNVGAEELYGYTAGEALGMPISLFVPPDRVDEVSTILALSLLGEQTDSYDTIRVGKDGKPINVSLTVSLIKDAESRVIGASNIARNITAQKRAEQKVAETQVELEQRNWELAEARDAALAAVRLKSEFLANMSHEIRTPMNGVLGMLGLLLDTPLDEEQAFFARTVKLSADALMTIINDILDFSKIEAGKMTIEHVDLPLRETLEDVADLLAPRAREKGVELFCDLPPLGKTPAAEALLGDPGRLRQVITNLVGNAVKFTDDGGEVVLGAELLWEGPTQARWRLSVRDTGIGIAPDRQAMIFESFTQADGSTTRRYGGTGLGLTISRQLTALMGGEIGVDSEIGQGSTFWVELTWDKQPEIPSCAVPSEETALAGVAVLLAGLSQSARTQIHRWLNAWGCVVMDDCGAERSLPDVILLDVDGAEEGPAILARFSASAPPALPILRLSGAVAVSSGEAPRPSLRKPIRQGALYESLRSLTGRCKMPSGTAVAATPVRAERLAAPARQGRILLAEDNPVNQMVAQRLLARLGFGPEAVTTVSTGRQALEALAASEFALVLMDVQMPEMDGLEAVAALRAQRGDCRLPVIAMTAHALAGDRERCLEAGMSDYISKPINSEKLTEVFGRWMPQSEIGDEITMIFSPSEQNDAIDTAALGAVSGGDPEIEADLAREFARSAPTMLTHCRRMLEKRDGAGLEHWAHTLKGSGQIFGAAAMVGHCQQLENLGRQGRLDEAVSVLQALESEWTRVQKQLARLWEKERIG